MWVILWSICVLCVFCGCCLVWWVCKRWFRVLWLVVCLWCLWVFGFGGLFAVDGDCFGVVLCVSFVDVVYLGWVGFVVLDVGFWL